MIQCGASWCGPCKVMKPKFTEAIKAHNGEINMLYVDVDKQKEVAQMLGVSHLDGFKRSILDPICACVLPDQIWNAR